MKSKGGVRLFQISQKERLFDLLWQPSALGSNLTMWPPSCTLQKRPSSLVHFGQKLNILDSQLKKKFTDLVWKLPGSSLFWQTSPHVRDTSMLFHSTKAFLLPSVWPGTEHTWALIWKESLIICFESYQSIPYSHTGRVDSNVNTLLMMNINLICKRWFRGLIIYVVYSFLSCVRKKWKPGFYLQQPGDTLALNL